MSAPIIPTSLEATPHRPRRSTWKFVNLKHLEELDVRATPVTKAGLKLFRGRTGLSVRQDDPNDPMSQFLISY